jgi:predicted ABC-type ATPase
MKERPFILVLAGVNGAGKSSVGGFRLLAQGLEWFNPDSFARQVIAELGCSLETANGLGWNYGRDKLVEAIDKGLNHAFETTLGANTIPGLLKDAAKTHEVRIWFCGLSSAELHIERVALRVASGGHDIPEAKIRERWEKSRINLVELIPHLTSLQVFDNSISVKPGEPIPAPKLILFLERSVIKTPDQSDATALAAVPGWAKPIVQATFDICGKNYSQDK